MELEKQLECLHYQCHFDNARDELTICPHYSGGQCELAEIYPTIFPEDCPAKST